MPKSRPNRPKKPPIEKSSNRSLFTPIPTLNSFKISPPSGPFRIGEKKGYP